mgnify:FL=1
MGKYLITMLYLGSLISFSCKKEDISYDIGTGSVVRNGTAITSVILAGYSGGLTNRITFNKQFYPLNPDWTESDLAINHIPLKEGKYSLKPSTTCRRVEVTDTGNVFVMDTNHVCAMYSIAADDLITNIYHPMPDSCILEITSLEIKKHKAEFEGKYYGTYIQDARFVTPEQRVPDTIRLKEGTFKFKVNL